jgi:hypothetical protein
MKELRPGNPLQEIEEGQIWTNRKNPRKSLKIIKKGVGYGYKYKHKASIRIAGLMEKEDWLNDSEIVLDYTIIDFVDKLDMVLGE